MAFNHPLYIPPKSPTQSAGPRLGAHKVDLEMDEKFGHFLTLIFRRFWVVLGCQLGAILGTFGGQVGLPTAIWCKMLIFEKMSATEGGSTILRSKSAQDRPKTAPRGSWRATFSLLKIVLNFDSFWVSIWVDFGPPRPPCQT